MKRTLAAEWEARLKIDGLASLDYADGDDVIVSNRGSGKLHPDDGALAQLHKRGSCEAAIDRARDVLRSHRFPTALDRRIWALHAEGLGTREIAKRVGFWRQGVRNSIAATEKAAKKKGQRHGTTKATIRRADTAFLCALFRATC